MGEIPDYNKLDPENDTIEVLDAKIKAIRKQREVLDEREKVLQDAIDKKTSEN